MLALGDSSAETLRKRLHLDDRSSGVRPGPTVTEQQQIKELERWGTQWQLPSAQTPPGSSLSVNPDLRGLCAGAGGCAVRPSIRRGP